MFDRDRWVAYLRQVQFGPRSLPLALLVICILAYALLLPFLGFYWDDWPWVWLSHLYGPAGMLEIDRLFRPLAGVILCFGALISGQGPFGWQVLNLLYRWLTALTFLWLLRCLWPRQVERAAWAALLFLVYPGFKQQFISINSSRHVLPLAFFCLSLGLMIQAVRAERLSVKRLGGALGLALLTMLSTEYYFGLEFVRPLALWLVIESPAGDWKLRLKRSLALWLPFLLLLVAVFAWRYTVSQQVNYPVTLTRQLAAAPLETIIFSLKISVSGLWTAAVLAWGQMVVFPQRSILGLKVVVGYWLLVVGTVSLAAGYLLRLKCELSEERNWMQPMMLGAAALLVGGLPFLATSISVELSFPADRTTLPLMFGACLLLVGLLDSLPVHRAWKVGVISLLVSLAVGMHLLNAVSYQREWQEQRALFNQLAWRAPQLRPGTAIYYTYNLALQDFRSTDNSLTAALNWMYASDFDPQAANNNLPYFFFDLRLRPGSGLPNLKAGQPVTARYGNMRFVGAANDALALHVAPPACLRVLAPRYDAQNPQLPDSLLQALPLVNLERIDLTLGVPANGLSAVFGPVSTADWCYYFEQADLARQFEDWQRVVAIGEAAFQQHFSPHHAAELVPFIQGYAHLGRWETAAQLTDQALQVNTLSGPMLCAVWSDLWQNTPDTPERQAAIDGMQKQLKCARP